MLERIRQWVLKLFGVKADSQPPEPDKYVKQYENISGENITATLSNKLAMLVFADSGVHVANQGKRSELIGKIMDNLWAHGPEIAAQVFGKGGKVLLPTVHDGHIDVSVIDQNRMVVRKTDGDKIVEASILCDIFLKDGQARYLLADYSLNHAGVQTIRYRVCDASGGEYSLADVPKWALVAPETVVANTDRLLFGFLKCPRDNRREQHVHGVPITYGAEKDVEELVEHLAIYRREFKLSRMMLGLDSSLWKGDPAGLSIDRVRKSVQDGDDPFIPVESMVIDGRSPWQQYAPAIRVAAMETRLGSLMRRVEKACGLSQGILTERQSVNYANKDEVRAAQYDTFSVVSAMRKAWEAAMDDAAYAADVLAEFYGLTPAGARDQYEITYDWDASMIESTTESFAQLSELQSRNLLSGAELRQWVRGGTLEEAEQAVSEIREAERMAVNEIREAERMAVSEIREAGTHGGERDPGGGSAWR